MGNREKRAGINATPARLVSSGRPFGMSDTNSRCRMTLPFKMMEFMAHAAAKVGRCSQVYAGALDEKKRIVLRTRVFVCDGNDCVHAVNRVF
jgi:hypothetical protein